MSMPLKKIFEKIKKQEINELNVNNLLENNWKEQYSNQIFKTGNLVYIKLSVKNGTATKILTLPQDFRPSALLYLSAVDTGGSTGLGTIITVSENGDLNCFDKNVGSLITVNAVFKV